MLDRVRALAMNLWWTWNPSAQRLFASMDPLLWIATNRGPIKTLNRLAPERRELLQSDERFAAAVAKVERELEQYLSARTWYDRTHGRKLERPLTIAYFCAEFAVHESLPQYSGGLGVLAGDHVKSASDLGVPLVGVGLLYHSGFYTQEFLPDGSTRVIYPEIDLSDLPIADTGKTVDVPMGRGTIKARVWKQQVGRVPVYLMDTNVPENKPGDRDLTRHLYGGDREYRIRQEMLLGVGGLLALESVGIRPTVSHMNEGHAAFAALERLRRLTRRGVSIYEAIDRVRGGGVFTTHTPVAAGNDRFVPQLTMKYLSQYAHDLGISRDEILALGREDPTNKSEEFCMTVLALKLSDHCNGVAQLHGDTSRRMWTSVYGHDGKPQPHDRVPIGHVTNGVHVQTWLAPEIGPLYDKYLKPKWVGAGPDDDWWQQVDRIPDAELWAMRNVLRTRMITFVRQRLAEQITRQNGPAEELIAAHTVFNKDALTIGFARRFATYKRAPLIFRSVERLAKILCDADRPVQLVFAGKAHPQDMGGQAFAQEIYRHARDARFSGRVVLLEDYDMNVGRILTSGCDVWLNNPLRPQEASGTSGMKPPLHGGLNCSVLDGWWPEAYDGNNGWAIGDGRAFKHQRQQDQYDAGAIYALLENEIVPLFYRRGKAGLPHGWVARMKHSMRTVCGRFNTHRMVAEYLENYYLPAHAEPQPKEDDPRDR